MSCVFKYTQTRYDIVAITSTITFKTRQLKIPFFELLTNSIHVLIIFIHSQHKPSTNSQTLDES